jgi:hypothetical protein
MKKISQKNITVQIPMEIITPKKPHRQDSVFYAGRDIARVKVGNKIYVLTTSGLYAFEYKGKQYKFDSSFDTVSVRGVRLVQGHQAVRRLTDKDIRKIEDPGNWGWFGINVWEISSSGKETCLLTPTDCYSDYNEAMKAFEYFIVTDLVGRIP